MRSTSDPSTAITWVGATAPSSTSSTSHVAPMSAASRSTTTIRTEPTIRSTTSSGWRGRTHVVRATTARCRQRPKDRPSRFAGTARCHRWPPEGSTPASSSVNAARSQVAVVVAQSPQVTEALSAAARAEDLDVVVTADLLEAFEIVRSGEPGIVLLEPFDDDGGFDLVAAIRDLGDRVRRWRADHHGRPRRSPVASRLRGDPHHRVARVAGQPVLPAHQAPGVAAPPGDPLAERAPSRRRGPSESTPCTTWVFSTPRRRSDSIVTPTTSPPSSTSPSRS